jgi:hypothetical protein
MRLGKLAFAVAVALAFLLAVSDSKGLAPRNRFPRELPRRPSHNWPDKTVEELPKLKLEVGELGAEPALAGMSADDESAPVELPIGAGCFAAEKSLPESRWGISPLESMVSTIADLGIALAYFSIPAALFYFLRQARTHLPVESVGLLFVAFISFCGTTHLVAAWLPWFPTIDLLIFFKILTAAISLYTAVVLVRLMPKAVQIPRFIQAMESELARKHLSERSLRWVDYAESPSLPPMLEADRRTPQVSKRRLGSPAPNRAQD